MLYLYVKGVPFVNKSYTKGASCLSKMVYKTKGKELVLGAESLRVKLCWMPLRERWFCLVLLSCGSFLRHVGRRR